MMPEGFCAVIVSVSTGVLISAGMIMTYLMNHMMRVNRHADYLLFYGLYALLYGGLKVAWVALLPDWVSVTILLDLVSTVMLVCALYAWGENGNMTRFPSPWLLVGAAAIVLLGDIPYYYAGAPWGRLLYNSFIAVLNLLVIVVVWRTSPRWVAVVIALGFLAWTLLSVGFLYPGEELGHALAILGKLLVFGGVMLAYYERTHRKLLQAVVYRQAAIDAIIVGTEMTDASIGPDRLKRYSKALGAYR